MTKESKYSSDNHVKPASHQVIKVAGVVSPEMFSSKVLWCIVGKFLLKLELTFKNICDMQCIL